MDEKPASRTGYDAARINREEDHLNRWPFAQEIYRIASNGPRDWSVRIGVYGEWGSGKTSVINFVNSMASQDGHIIFTFNPWQFQTTEDLWKAFVEGLFTKIKDTTEIEDKQAGGRKAKAVLGTVAKVLPNIISTWNDEAGNVAKSGLGLLRKYLIFSADDLVRLKDVLGERRLIVTIDDLDRTDAKLVPEILFALKEIMDVPGMAFICAFDPVVVGKVLCNSHSGFGDGLDFLEKIIDYPRWLPQPNKQQLAKLAVADAAKFCPDVPPDELTEMVGLLPKNPRAIRKFIRILDLLSDQIQRHHPYEIKWSIILASNVLKVRFPKISHAILGDREFWVSIYETTIMGKQNGEEIKKLLDEKISKVAKDESRLNHISNMDELVNCVTSIAAKLNAWHGLDPDFMNYQFHLAEAPCAVTWKEYDTFLEHLDTNTISLEIVREWIETHTLNGHQTNEQVYSELLSATIKRRSHYLSNAAGAMPGRVMNDWLEKASDLLRVIDILFNELPLIAPKLHTPSNEHISEFFNQVGTYYHWRRTRAYRAARKEEEKVLKKLFSKNPDSVEPWIEIIGIRDVYRRHEDHGDEWKNLIIKFRSVLHDRCSKWLIEQLPQRTEFMRHVINDEKRGYIYKELFLDLKSPVWGKYRKRLLGSLKPKQGYTTLQNNAYELLSWLEYAVSETRIESQAARDVLAQTDFSSRLWKACVFEPLNPRAVGSLIDAHELLICLGVECKTPAWWDRIVSKLPKP